MLSNNGNVSNYLRTDPMEHAYKSGTNRPTTVQITKLVSNLCRNFIEIGYKLWKLEPKDHGNLVVKIVQRRKVNELHKDYIRKTL